MSDRPQFAEVDAANPHIWILFERIALGLVRQGFSRHSADAVLHRVRWELSLALHDGYRFKVSNTWSAYYARKFVATHPAHADLFELRASAADQPPPPSPQLNLGLWR